MAYLVITDRDGQTKEIRAQEDVKSYENDFMKALEAKINANKEAGLAPLEGIDFPSMNKDNELAPYLRDSAIITSAITSHIANPRNNPEPVLQFINQGNLDERGQTYKNDKLSIAIHKGLNARWERGDDAALKSVPLDTLAKDAAFVYHNDELSDNTMLLTYCSDEMLARIENGDNLSRAGVEALSKAVPGMSYSDIGRLAPVFSKLDLANLDDSAKKKIEATAGKNYRETAPIKNLSEEAFLKRENLTLEDVSAYYPPHSRDGIIDTYFQIHYKGENTGEAFNAVRGQVAVQAFDSWLKQNPGKEISDFARGNRIAVEQDLLRGYKDNPEALKKLGVELPSSVANLVKDEEQFKNDPDLKYVVEARQFRSEISLSSLQEIGEKGFAAGYGAEMVVTEARRQLESKRAKTTETAERLAADKQKLNLYDQAQNRKNGLEELKHDLNPAQTLTDQECLKNFGVSQADVERMFFDKAAGKDVKPLSGQLQATTGLKRLFMSSQKKKAEAQAIAAQQEAAKKMNEAIAAFGAKHRNNPLLQAYSSMAAVDKQISEDDKTLRSTYRPMESEIERMQKEVDDFSRLETACQSASQKLESQVAEGQYQHQLRETAQETDNAAFREAKVQLRQENPEMSTRELYAAAQKKVRDEQKVEMPTGSLQAFHDNRSTARKITEMRGIGTSKPKAPVQKTTIDRQQVTQNTNNR